MENSPPGIHTIPSGTGLGGFEELAIVGAKDEVSFGADATGSTACALSASVSASTAVNGSSLVSFMVLFRCFIVFASHCPLSHSGAPGAGTRHTRRSSPRGEPPPAVTPRRAVPSQCRQWREQRRRKATLRRLILSRCGFACHLAQASMRHPAQATPPHPRATVNAAGASSGAPATRSATVAERQQSKRQSSCRFNHRHHGVQSFHGRGTVEQEAARASGRCWFTRLIPRSPHLPAHGRLLVHFGGC